jgi:anaerobic selenocysteine-containing dehydrogenase
MVRKPGSDKFERISWDAAMDRIAKLMKEDRDKNFVAKNRDGVTVNRWLTDRFLRHLVAKQRGGLPHLQARARDGDTGVRRPSPNMTRTDGGQSWPHIRTWRDDELLERYQEH